MDWHNCTGLPYKLVTTPDQPKVELICVHLGGLDEGGGKYNWGRWGGVEGEWGAVFLAISESFYLFPEKYN